MADRRTPSQIINYWAPKLGLEPRAVKAVAMGEGGLKWDVRGDGGHAFGPFQMNDAGGVLTDRFGSSAAREAYANSPQGLREAMKAMANYGARGQRGLQALTTIISKYERPKDIPGSIERAKAHYKGLGSDPTEIRTLNSFSSGSQKQAISNYFRSRALSLLRDDPVPDGVSLASVLRAINSDSSFDEARVSYGGEIPSSARPIGDSDTPFVIRAGNFARNMGLTVSENPYFDKVDPVHVEDSDHYRNVGSYNGRAYGAALDVSGDPAKQKRFFKWLEANRGMGLDDMFYTPMGYSYDEGKLWDSTIKNHDTHVHASFS